MNTRQYLEACGLSAETARAFGAIRIGRRQVDTARRAADDRAERAARRAIDALRRAIDEETDSARFA